MKKYFTKSCWKSQMKCRTEFFFFGSLIVWASLYWYEAYVSYLRSDIYGVAGFLGCAIWCGFYYFSWSVYNDEKKVFNRFSKNMMNDWGKTIEDWDKASEAWKEEVGLRDAEILKLQKEILEMRKSSEIEESSPQVNKVRRLK